MHGPPKQEVDNFQRRVEVAAEAVAVGVVSDQFAQTTRKCPKQTRIMRNTTMNWAWSKRLKEKNSGLHCEETSRIVFVLLGQKGTQALINFMGVC